MSHLSEIVTNFKGSLKRRQYKTGGNYYNSLNEVILKRKFQSGFATPKSENKFSVTIREDPFKANNKITSSWYKLLIDQAINYLLGKSPTYIEKKPDAEVIGDSKVKEMFSRLASLFKKVKTTDETDAKVKIFYSKKFDRVLKSVAKSSKIKGISWGHVFIENGILKTKLVEPDNIIAKFDSDDKLIWVLKFWWIEEVIKKKTVDILMVEKWDDKEVTLIRVEDEKESIISQQPHIVIQTVFDNGEVQIKETHSWGFVPFIPLFNNIDQIFDLRPIKTPIDGYDIVSSDFLNNLEDFQDIFWILKNYQGQDLETFLHDVKVNKVLKVGQDGDAKAEKIDIPHEARQIALDIARMQIFDWGQGVDIKDLSGGNLTNSAIITKYFNLMIKVSDFKPFVEDYIDQYQLFVNRFIEINGLGDPLFVDVKFNVTTPINEKELLEMNIKLKGDLSDRTRFEDNALVEDVDQEFERIAEERENAIMEFDTGEVNTDGDNE